MASIQTDKENSFSLSTDSQDTVWNCDTFDGESMVRFLETLITKRDILEMVVIRRASHADIIKASRKTNRSRDLKNFFFRTYVAWSERPL
jgi:hypothetical protein